MADTAQTVGKGMLAVTWVLLLGLLTWFFSGVEERRHNPNARPHSVSDDGVASVTLQRNAYGHYVANGTINGQAVTFLLDTGATSVAVPSRLAGRLGLQPGPALQVETANGTVTAYGTRIDRVKLGDIELEDVRATINPGMDANEEVLLGMSFLKHLEFTQRGDQLILRQY